MVFSGIKMHFFRGGGADAPGTVAFWSPWHFCSPLRYRNGHWQFLHTRNNGSNGVNGSNGSNGPIKPIKNDYTAHKEQQKRIRKAEKAVEESERKISDMERRLKELDNLLMIPENAADMTLVTEYTTTKKALDEEVERWERLSEELETIN